MSRGLGTVQLEILGRLALDALNLAEDTGLDTHPAHWNDLPSVLNIQHDLARSGSARRAVLTLVARGLLEVTLMPVETAYRRAGEDFYTDRWTTHVRLPPVRFDPQVAQLRGTPVDQHCHGIADALATHRQLAEQWDDARHEPDRLLLALRYETGVQETRRVVAYHLRQLDGFPAISPIGWPHVFTRHVAHWAYEASTVPE
jgi:hypothetical protein